MGVRINKVLNDLNIGLQTAIDFLKHRRDLGEIRDDMTPNTKISDEQYEALVKEFRGDKNVKEKADNIFRSINSRSSKSSETKQKKDNKASSIYGFKPIGKIDLDALASPSQSTNQNTKPLDGFDWDAFENGVQATAIEDDEVVSTNNIHEHEIVSGVIISIDRKEVVVNIAYKQDCIIPASEFRYNPDLKVGDSVEVYVEAYDKGRLILSHKKARLSRSWEQVNKALDNNETITSFVKCRTKGGMIVDIFGVEAFLPGSEVDIVKVYNLDEFVGKNLEVKVIKVNKEFRNVVVSHKVVVQENLNRKQTDKTLLKDIWQKHTEVQEQILRQRTAPITILPHLSTIINDKLHVRVDTSDNTELLKSKIIESLDLTEDDCHFDDGYVLAPLSNWEKLDERTKSKISTRANSEYVTFTYYPVIDGKITDKKAQFTEVKALLDKLGIEYDFDKTRRLQISLNDLQKLREDEEFVQMNISLPEKASAIVPTYPSIITYLHRFCPNHKIENFETFHENKGASSEVYINKQIIVNGGYLKRETLDIVNPIFDLRMYKAEFIFKLTESAIRKYDWKKNEDGLPKLENGCISFQRDVKIVKTDDFGYDSDDVDIPSVSTEEFKYINRKPRIEDLNLEYSMLKRGLDRILGEGQYWLENERYFYYYKENRNWATPEELDIFNDSIHSEIKQTEDVRIQNNGLSIGIDFNWKETSLADILTDLSKQHPDIDFGLFKKGHKCKFDIQYKKVNLTGIIEELHNSFEDLVVELGGKGTELTFYREFQSYDELKAFKLQLSHKLSTFDFSRYNCIINKVPSDKVKLIYFNDKASREEEQQAAARELKGADFKVNDLTIGRLIRVSNYPELVIDISGNNFDITKQLFEETDVTSITPDLSGDLEKLARLKRSLNRIVNNDQVENPSLGDFIFDASKAHDIKDYEDNIRLELQEISEHILNNKIDKNDPQKMAIAKALLAPDLALIQGPPGTGKSTAIAEMIWQHTRKDPEKRILLTSETNLAVDNAIDRVVNPYHNLIKPIRIGDESRLETEGLQFSYSAMYRWAKGEDWNIKKKPDEDEEYDDESFAEDEESVYEAPEKLILLNWMENINRRVDKERMPIKAQTLWKELLDEPTPEVKNMFFENYVDNCNVIGATCSSIGKENIILTESIEDTSKKGRFVPTQFYRIYREIFRKRDNEYNPKIRFDVVIQDESSKATPAELSLPLIYGVKNVIIGDHRQLPPMLSRESFINSFDFLIKREKNEDERNKLKELKSYVLKNFKTLEVSHFERLFNQIDDKWKGVFNYQFRMHPAINEVIKQFYHDVGGLKCGLIDPVDLGIDDPNFIENKASRYHGISVGEITPDTHVVWIDSNSPEMLDGTSRVNYGEVSIIRKLLTQLNESESFHEYNNKWNNIEDRQIGLISFYGKQLRLLREMTKEFDYNELPIRVSTVDRFQGMERNIVIVSMVRSHCIQTEKGQKPNYEKYPEYGYAKQEDLGFAQSPNRLNVALSRAKRLLIIVGDSKLFRSKDIYNNVYTTIENHANGKILKAEDYGL